MDDYIPFGAAIIMYLFNPLIEKKAQAAVFKSISESDQRMPDAASVVIPAHRSDPSIKSYLSFVIDAAQIVPAVILTAVGVILAIPSDWSPALAAVLVLGICLLVLAVDAYVLSLDPHVYDGKRVRGYTFTAIAGIGLNAICIALVAFLGA
ncbi:hypothetical protein ACFV7R_10165 [Streptomyces sp. NPDC059866]|uniref:hypothetical protein n=1 Tax=Streptomyces sp. NPDC059866 TaxID=3346978 RepID=UPI0036600F16